MKNALTVDLEDWYHICGEGGQADPSTWGSYESRVTRSTVEVLKILDAFGVKATFFVLGYIAEKHPALISKIFDAGHEIAVHGYYHRRIFDMSPAEFEEDLERSMAVVESITGEKPVGHRAPEWSMTAETGWALEIMAKVGLRYDSSMVPMTRMGERSFKRFPHAVETGYGTLMEFPLTTLRCFWENLPVTGGLPLRITPYWFVVHTIKSLNDAGHPAMVYVHPWEFDDDMPEIELPWSRRFMHYFNLKATRPKLEGMLKHFAFAPMREVLGRDVLELQ